MAAFADLAAKAALDMVTGKASTTLAAAARYLALLTAVTPGTGDAGTGFTEVSASGTAYARQLIATASWNAATGSSPSSATTNAAVSFPTSTADQTGGGTTPIIAWALTTDTAAISGTNLVAWDYLGNFAWLPSTVSAASPANISVPAHGYAAGDAVVFTTEFGGVAPTLSAGSLSGLLRVVSVVDANTITVASGATFNSSGVLTGGTTVNASAVGNGCIRKVLPQLVPNNTTLSVGAGGVVLSQA